MSDDDNEYFTNGIKSKLQYQRLKCPLEAVYREACSQNYATELKQGAGDPYKNSQLQL